MRSSDINVHRFLQLYVRTDLDATLYYELTCPEIIFHSFNSFVRGHHVYKDEWTPTVGESLNCVREPLNGKDKNAVAVMRDDKVVGHVLLPYSRCVSQILEINSSAVTCTVTGKRVNRGGGYGLEVPCQYSFKGNSLTVKGLSERFAKERKIFEDALARNQERKTGSKREQ